MYQLTKQPRKISLACASVENPETQETIDLSPSNSVSCKYYQIIKSRYYIYTWAEKSLVRLDHYSREYYKSRGKVNLERNVAISRVLTFNKYGVLIFFSAYRQYMHKL